MTRDVLITGAGGGLGGATTKLLAGNGWRVFAADLTPPAEAPNVIPITMDVTDDDSVAAALVEVDKKSAGLAGVVHFAGILRVGALLDMDADELAHVLDVNVLGAHRVTKAAFPLLFKGGGRVVLISSETGLQSGAPFNGIYGMSKHAVEAYGDSLRREFMFLGIPVIKIEPGPFRTDLVESLVRVYEKAVEKSIMHTEQLRTMVQLLPAEQAKAHDPALLAPVVEKALTKKTWRASYLVRPDRQRMLMDKLSPRTADLLIRLAVRKHRQRAPESVPSTHGHSRS
jgi:NAD(P)-dependent dehydrogenase (short-subunit alcohol dehydrogenase family)